MLTEQERIAGYVRLWSEVKYNFAFFDKVPQLDWDHVLDQYLSQVQQAKDIFDYYRILTRCMALLHDGHSRVWGPNNDPAAIPPIQIQPVNHQATITAILSSEAINNAAGRSEIELASLMLGEEITHIDGRKVADLLRQEIAPYISSSTEQWLEQEGFPRLLKGEPDSMVRLMIRALDGSEREVSLTRGKYSFPIPEPQPFTRDLGDGLLYINLSSFDSDQIVKDFIAIFSQVKQARGLILDVRENGGGSTNVGTAIISHLTDKELRGSKWKTRLYRPAYRAWGQPEAWEEGDHPSVKPVSDPYLGPVVVLIGPRTGSAAEDFLVVLHYSKRATLVGRPTAGTTGQPLVIELPGGGGACVCTKRDTYPDGRDFVGVGIIPDVEINLEAADIIADQDRVLEAGISVLKKSMLPRLV